MNEQVKRNRARFPSEFVFRLTAAQKEEVAASRDINNALNHLERRVGTHDRAIAQIFNALRQLTAPPEPLKRRRIGFL